LFRRSIGNSGSLPERGYEINSARVEHSTILKSRKPNEKSRDVALTSNKTACTVSGSFYPFALAINAAKQNHLQLLQILMNDDHDKGVITSVVGLEKYLADLNAELATELYKEKAEFFTMSQKICEDYYSLCTTQVKEGTYLVLPPKQLKTLVGLQLRSERLFSYQATLGCKADQCKERAKARDIKEDIVFFEKLATICDRAYLMLEIIKAYLDYCLTRQTEINLATLVNNVHSALFLTIKPTDCAHYDKSFNEILTYLINAQVLCQMDPVNLSAYERDVLSAIAKKNQQLTEKQAIGRSASREKKQTLKTVITQSVSISKGASVYYAIEKINFTLQAPFDRETLLTRIERLLIETEAQLEKIVDEVDNTLKSNECALEVKTIIEIAKKVKRWMSDDDITRMIESLTVQYEIERLSKESKSVEEKCIQVMAVIDKMTIKISDKKEMIQWLVDHPDPLLFSDPLMRDYTRQGIIDWLCGIAIPPNTVVDNQGNCLLHYAIAHGENELKVARFLVSIGAHLDTDDVRNVRGQTPLMLFDFHQEYIKPLFLISDAPERSRSTFQLVVHNKIDDAKTQLDERISRWTYPLWMSFLSIFDTKRYKARMRLENAERSCIEKFFDGIKEDLQTLQDEKTKAVFNLLLEEYRTYCLNTSSERVRSVIDQLKGFSQLVEHDKEEAILLQGIRWRTVALHQGTPLAVQEEQSFRLQQALERSQKENEKLRKDNQILISENQGLTELNARVEREREASRQELLNMESKLEKTTAEGKKTMADLEKRTADLEKKTDEGKETQARLERLEKLFNQEYGSKYNPR
jgi:hypothetical protein